MFLVPAEHSDRVQVELLGPGLPPDTQERPADSTMARAVSGRMFHVLRERRGLISSIDVDVRVGPTTGTSVIHFTFTPEHA